MIILGIETSCDETSAAVIEDGRRVRANLIASQIEVHARYGGVVPEIASRQHLLQIVPILRQALSTAGVTWKDLDAIAVTVGPGLAGALLVGVNTAKALALARGLPLIGVNHLEAHIYANWLEGASTDPAPPQFPLLCLIASGGHTDLVLMRGHGRYQLLGRTRDDAAGEAFDKVARILGLGYPGGPLIQQTALEALAPQALPRAWLSGTHDFSFSGLKTAALHAAQEQGLWPQPDAQRLQALRPAVANLAAGLQEAIVDVLVEKTIAAAVQHEVRIVLLAGGVAANRPLRERLVARAPMPVRIPPPLFCTDNAAMLAACAYYKLREQAPAAGELDVSPNLRLVVEA